MQHKCILSLLAIPEDQLLLHKCFINWDLNHFVISIEQVSIASGLKTCVWEVPALNLDWKHRLSCKRFLIFFIPSRRFPGSTSITERPLPNPFQFIDCHLSFVLPSEAAVAQWLRCCATNQKVAGSIPAGVIDIKSFRWPWGVDSASNRNEYQEHFLGVKAAGA